MTKEKSKKQVCYSFAPIPIVNEACKKREGGLCQAYEFKREIRKGKEADVHYCHANPAFCDHVMGIALELSDPTTKLSKKYFRK